MFIACVIINKYICLNLNKFFFIFSFFSFIKFFCNKLTLNNESLIFFSNTGKWYIGSYISPFKSFISKISNAIPFFNVDTLASVTLKPETETPPDNLYNNPGVSLV